MVRITGTKDEWAFNSVSSAPRIPRCRLCIKRHSRRKTCENWPPCMRSRNAGGWLGARTGPDSLSVGRIPERSMAEQCKQHQPSNSRPGAAGSNQQRGKLGSSDIPRTGSARGGFPIAAIFTGLANLHPGARFGDLFRSAGEKRVVLFLLLQRRQRSVAAGEHRILRQLENLLLVVAELHLVIRDAAAHRAGEE